VVFFVFTLLRSRPMARQQARNTNCLSNLKAQGIATQFYLNSNKEHFPLRAATAAPGGGGVKNALEPTRTILKQDHRPLEIFACPNDTEELRVYELGEELSTP